jgi:hypothetical protein
VTSLSKDEKPNFERVGFGKKVRAIHRKLAIDTEFDGVDLRVFLYLTSCLDFENFLQAPRLEIAKTLGRRKEHISRSMAKLKTKKVVIAGPKVGRSAVWRLNPDFGS